MASGSGNRSDSKSFVARGWARLSGRRKKTRFPNPAIPEDEPIEVAEVAQEDTFDVHPMEASSPQKGRFNRGMDRLRRSLRESFRRKPKSRSADSAPSELTPASTSGTNSSERNPAWHVVEDEVRSGRCQFDVKYLGAIEVFESRGMDVCENAMKVMRTQRRRVIKGVLYVSGDGLRVVDSEDNHGLLVDQTIEKVSFCSPDRNHPKGFAYICRDGTTRRWMCHGFHAAKDSGERLSHAVGCAFAICLEKKRKREAASFDGTTAKESTENAGTVNGGFANCRNNKAYSSFNRQLTISERLQDPQSAIVNEAPPSASTSLSEDRVLPRPLGNRSLFERQGSFKAPEQASSAVSFRRQFSLRTEGQTKPSFNGLSQIRNEPIIEGEELWPEASLISQFATLPTSSSFQSTLAPTPNQPDVATQKFSASSAFQNDGWQGTPVKRLNQSSTAVPPNTSSTSSAPVDWNLCLNSPAKGVKADDWLEQMLRNTSAASMSLPMVPEKKGVGSGPPPAHPPPPLPPTAEKLAAVLGSSPPSVADPFAKGYQRLRNSAEISFSEDLNAPTVAKVGDSTNSIEYSLLNESVNNSAASTALDLTTSCGATDLFGQPVFSPVPHTASTTPSHLSNGVVRSTNTSASSGVAPSDDPFDVKWSTLAISSTATKSTNPFANTLTAAR